MAVPQTLSPSPVSSHRWWRQLSAVLLILVELFWVLPWYQMVIQISHGASILRAGLVLGGVMAAGLVITQLMERLRLLQGVQLGVLILVLVSSVLLAENLLLEAPALLVMNGLVELDPGAILVLFATLWIWWRGISLAREPVRPMVAWRRFETGLLLFMAYLFIVFRQGTPSPGLAWFIGFLFVGFMAVVFARVSYVGITRGVTKNPFDRRWLASTTAILGGAVLAAALLGGVLTGQYRMLLDVSVEVLRMLFGVAMFFISLPGLLLGMLLGPLGPWLMRLFSKATPSPTVPVEGLSAYAAPVMEARSAVLSPWLQAGCFWGVIILIVGVLILRVRQRLMLKTFSESEAPESLLKQGEARQLLRKIVQDALDDLVARLKPEQRILAAAQVRRIYIHLMDLCADLNRPRPAGRTPLEFLPDMGEIFSELHAELAIITHAYIRVRYGQYPETQQEIDEVEAAWKLLSEEGERLKKAGWGKLQTVEVKEIERQGV
jgi:hypothetical protein